MIAWRRDPQPGAARPVVLAAGGTGGHLFPAEALARELIERGHPVTLITDRRGSNFPVAGVVTHRIPAGRFEAGLRSKLSGLAGLATGMVFALRLLMRLKPAAVIGFGGYPSMPTMMAACRLGLPTLIHEQNAVLGRANRVLASRVTRIATHFSQVEWAKTRANEAALRPKLVHTGNPVRPAFAAIGLTPYAAPGPQDPFNLLIIGGSQGARILSLVVPDALKALPEGLRRRLSVSQQARPEDLASVEALYRNSGLHVELRSFFDDIPARLAQAHLVICRAGGSTTAELTVAGRPSILIPYAAAIADEQTANARHLVDAGGAWLLREAEFTPERLAALIEHLSITPEALTRAARAAHSLGRPEAARDLADLVEAIATNQQPQKAAIERAWA